MEDHHFFPVASIFLMLCLFYLINFTASVDDPAYLPGDVSISCGSVGTSAAHNGRQWIGDMHPRFASSVQIKGKPTISSVAWDDPVPYKTARISRSGFSYVFLVNPGEKFIRLHFNPAPYKGFQKYKDLFTVEAGPFTLLSNFSASLTADALALSSIIKEFCISVEENQPLHVVFTPASSRSGDTYAFLNGIEIITVPLGHSYFHADGDIGALVVGRKSQWFYVDNSTVLEMVRRVNIQRDGYVSSGGDISDTFGILATAPKEKANLINNITWKIPVDVGFRYLARLHFSDVGLKMLQETGSVNFKVLINVMIAYDNIDFVRERDTSNIMMYKDYMVMLKGQKGAKHHILVSLQSYGVSIDGYVPFTGFEILKLSNFDNSLACPNPSPPALDSPSSTIQILLSVLGHRNAIVTISITIIVLANIIAHRLREIWEDSTFTEEEIKPSAKAERFCRRFTLAEIQLATKNFSYHLIIGKGGFGNVYKGLIDNGKETIAVKRLKFDSSQGAHEFLTEIETLSELRHINIVSLIGYCNEQMEMILVYEYMAGGTLGDHLHKLARKGNFCASLTWKKRLNICIGAGRGLDYLHTGHGVIHRDVKASNILLDENLTPKVSDFGLVKHENLSNLQSHISTKVKGTFGYLDPTYSSTGKLTRESDVYAFGVVLLEVLCGRPAVDQKVPEAEQILTKWARNKIREEEVELIVDLNLKQEISPNSLKAFVDIVGRCLDDEPKKRPTMAQVVLQLKFSLEQQDIVESSVPKEITIDTSCTDEVKPCRKNENSISEICEEEVYLPKYDWAKIALATNHFSSSNMIGENRTYKAVLPSGQIVAVKRYSNKEEFVTELLVVQKIQHPNILKLLGYCVHKEDIILVSEFMENKSLDKFIFGKSQHLQWTERFKIIMGIARGVAYLHQDLGMRIIHRDLKPSHILLDINMNPKISGFGLAKTLEEDSYESTGVGGTMGYLSLEHFLHNKVSIKTDVFSFGLVVLEIVSGRKSIGDGQYIVPDAIGMWKKNKALELVDESIRGDLSTPMEEEVLRCVKVGLFCTQQDTRCRPTMPSVIKLLEGELSIYKPAQMAISEYKHRTIQWKKTSSQLRILACFFSARNIPTLINLIETSRGKGKKGGLCVYAMHLMEFSERSSAILMVHKARRNGMQFWNKSQDSNLNQIVVAFETFQHLSQVSIQPMTAISPMSSMHEDICSSAERKRAAIIILPFHKHQRLDGRLETTQIDLRYVNRRILEHAPCSVGILVDRGLGGTSHVSASNVNYTITVFFFGGRDDREALSHGGLMAEHPGISLNVVRFIVHPKVVVYSVQLDIDNQNGSESRSDDEEFLAEFKNRVSEDGSIKFEEITVSDEAETTNAIRTFSRCNLILVGRMPEGQLVATLNKRCECPELGPVGNLLISPGFTTTASVLVVQQYRSKLTGDSLKSLKEEGTTTEGESD